MGLLQDLLFCPQYLSGAAASHFLAMSCGSQVISEWALPPLSYNSSQLWHFIIDQDDPPSLTDAQGLDLLISDDLVLPDTSGTFSLITTEIRPSEVAPSPHLNHKCSALRSQFPTLLSSWFRQHSPYNRMILRALDPGFHPPSPPSWLHFCNLQAKSIIIIITSATLFLFSSIALSLRNSNSRWT